jgi:ribosomal-protein-alanine N-acetyltransferase
VSEAFTIHSLEGDADLDGVLEVEQESFSSPWTREMYTWELQNPSVSHIYVLRTPECAVAGFAAFWLVFDEIHINNIAMRPHYRGTGLGSALLKHILREGIRLGATRATLEVREGNTGARRLYERLGFHVAGIRKRYYSNPEEDALILWCEDPAAIVAG